MEFEISENSLAKTSSDGVVVFVFEKDKKFEKTKAFVEIDKQLENSLSNYLEIENFKPKAGEFLSFPTSKKLLASRVFVLGLGKKEEFTANKLRKSLAVLSKNVKNKVSSLAVSLLDSPETSLNPEEQSQMIAEGVLLGSYEFNKYKEKDEDKKKLELVIFAGENKKDRLEEIHKGVKTAEIYCEATKLARDLVNEPSEIVTPTFLANTAKEIAEGSPEIRCTVYNKNELEQMGMHAFLGVARAADTLAKFIYLSYSPKVTKNNKKLAIVGKGITFDSGGINVKSSESMKTMKMDMSGAAAVLGAFSVISKIKPDFTVMGIIAATANLISGKSLAPGDVLKAYNGKTIEILDTDAEGRVTMADSLSFAVKKGATEILDLATLTGACMVALGADIAGLFGNDESLRERVKSAGFDAGEKLWELPLEEEYKQLNKSDVADVANIPSTRYGGAITAALFLREFIDNKPWVHLDIAGPAFAEKSFDLGPKGGTGFGVRTILNYLKRE